MNPVIDNSTLKRFELIEDNKLAYADYSIQDGVLVIPHVEADPALRGKGSAGRLMEGMLGIIRDRKLKVRPVCSYAIAYIHRHPEHSDLLA